MTQETGNYLTLTLADGAKLAYEVLGTKHIGKSQPIVLIGGMSSRRGDWERLALSLEKDRPVLLFDHRGMGDSVLTPSKDEHLTIEMMARDLLQILQVLQWKDISICGFSMGGVIAQQLLFLPYHPATPTSLPFRVTHLFLTGTLTSALRDRRYGLPFDRTVSDKPRTLEEKREVARPTLEATFDPAWLANPDNLPRFNWLLDRMTSGRPVRTIIMQARAMNGLNFQGMYEHLSKDTQIMVIHGQLDAIVPFYCAEEIMRRFPSAKFVEIGARPGQIPNLGFGHHWFEYFDIQVWHDVITQFLGQSNADELGRRARL